MRGKGKYPFFSMSVIPVIDGKEKTRHKSIVVTEKSPHSQTET